MVAPGKTKTHEVKDHHDYAKGTCGECNVGRIEGEP
jgi:hypothetical protein